MENIFLFTIMKYEVNCIKD